MMKTASSHLIARPARTCIASLSLALAAGCSALTPGASPTPPVFYSINSGPVSAAPAPTSLAVGLHTLIVTETHAAAGYDSQRIIYVRQPHRLEYFAHSEWVEPPARMVSSLVVGALEKSGVFRAVVSAPGSASGDLRLETEVLLLQHEFASPPSRVRFALRAYIAEDGTRKVLATRDFEVTVPAPSEDPYGGVQAANAAVRQVLEQLTAFCAQTVAAWPPSRKPASR